MHSKKKKKIVSVINKIHVRVNKVVIIKQFSNKRVPV